MKIDTVIFDLGGTLIEYAGPFANWPDLETPGFQAAYDYLNQDGLNLPEFEAFKAAGFAHLPQRWQRAVEGQENLRLVDLLTEVLMQVGITAVSPQWASQAAALYEQAICAQAHPIPGGQTVLRQLQDAGYKIGLLSNTMFTGQAHINDLQRFGLDHFFESMLFSADVNKWKPRPDPFLQVVADLDATPETAVFVGDSPAHDIVGAQQAGLQAIHFQSSQRFPIPVGVQADATIGALADLIPAIRQWD